MDLCIQIAPDSLPVLSDKLDSKEFDAYRSEVLI
jgi:hypothetical protein